MTEGTDHLTIPAKHLDAKCPGRPHVGDIDSKKGFGMIGKYAYNENTEQLIGKITGEDATHWTTLDSTNSTKRIAKQITIVQDTDGPLRIQVDLSKKYVQGNVQADAQNSASPGLICPTCNTINPADAASCKVCDTSFAYMSDPAFRNRTTNIESGHAAAQGAESESQNEGYSNQIPSSKSDAIVFMKDGQRISVPVGFAWPVLAAGIVTLLFAPIGILGLSIYYFALGAKVHGTAALLFCVSILFLAFNGSGTGLTGAILLFTVPAGIAMIVGGFFAHGALAKYFRNKGWKEVEDSQAAPISQPHGTIQSEDQIPIAIPEHPRTNEKTTIHSVTNSKILDTKPHNSQDKKVPNGFIPLYCFIGYIVLSIAQGALASSSQSNRVSPIQVKLLIFQVSILIFIFAQAIRCIKASQKNTLNIIMLVLASLLLITQSLSLAYVMGQ